MNCGNATISLSLGFQPPENCEHAAFGGYKQSGIGRENHRMMLDHYQQTKNLLVSYSDNALGFF
ncbi:MAG: aldehyde dehydrogenase family protein [Pseudonocardiaceae bacterium]